ncbi:MAG: site-specific integrase [bacterium]|nr:site-specific integrase [bacterium]
MGTLTIRKTKDGEVRYRAQVRLKGFPAETETFRRKTDAKKWITDIEAAMRDGRHFKTSEAKRHTVGELIDRYVRDVLPSKPRSAYSQGGQLKWWRQHLGDYLLSDATPALIAEARDTLSKGITHRRMPRTPATVNRYLAVLSHTFTIAMKEWGWVEHNPVMKVRRLQEAQGRVRFLSDDERDRLLIACRESDNKQLYVIVVLALSTGMRQGEILNLTWDNVDLDAGRVTLHDTKNKERRGVPVMGHAMDVLREHSKVRRIDTSLVFPSSAKDKPLDVRAPWERAVEAAGIEDFRFHDLRHSAASYLAMNGATPSELAAVLGHKTLQMVKRYAHLSDAHTAELVEKMNARIFKEH